MSDVSYRVATADDAAAVAALHADSWRRHYRDAYPESFFGSSLDEDRLSVWSSRLAAPEGTATIVAMGEDEPGVAGFVHVRFRDDARWGALVDNLHVRHDVRRRGIASRLMAQAATAAVASSPGDGVYLWVLELNAGAQAFYRARGGVLVDTRPLDPPALPGTLARRVVWPDPTVLTTAS